ncbi:hypothetical protein BDR22DRAFT_883884 [Usnea florida]
MSDAASLETNLTWNRNSLPNRMFAIYSFKHLDSLLAARATFTCDGNQYGYPPLIQCREVLKYMPNVRGFKTYGDGTIAGRNVDIPLPAYYFSNDRKCIIEVFTQTEGQIDVTEPMYLKKKINYLLNKCVGPSTQGYLPEGGLGQHLGRNGLLNFVVSQPSTTKNVKCFTPVASAPESVECQKALSTIPVSRASQWFGERGELGVDVGLPLRYVGRTPRLQCSIDVVIDGPEIKTSWYKLWSAAASIVAVCASDNKDGVSTVTAGQTELAVWVSAGLPDTPVSTE